MRYIYQILAIIGLLVPVSFNAAHAASSPVNSTSNNRAASDVQADARGFSAFVEPLYWRPTETVDWAFTNDESLPNQHVDYKTIDFDYATGIRVGVGYSGSWDTDFYYTKYDTDSKASTRGNVTSAFLGAKLSSSSQGFSFDAGQVDADIDFDMFDWDVGKRIYVNKSLMLRPIVGLRGGWIDQSIDSAFQGSHSVTEKINNDFTGIGPKVGIDGKLTVASDNDYQLNLVANFASAYLWGHWDIKDVLYDSNGRMIDVATKDRHEGELALQALLGVSVDYKQLSINFGYEINDYLNQVQIFDDASGAHKNDLILQGVTLRLTYHFC